MRHFIFIVLLGLLMFSAQAQRAKILNYSTHDDKPIHFGFCLGLNSMDFIIKHSDNAIPRGAFIADISKSNPGFHIQIVSNYRLGEYFDLRFLPGISFGQRDFMFYKKDSLVNENHKLESNYLEFPLLLKYKAKRLNNMRPYVISGTNFRVDLAKTFSEEDEIYMDLKRFDLNYEVGVGIDFYLPYFKLTTEIKYSYGFFNMLERRNTNEPQYQSAIERLNSSIFMFSLYFE
ncbi:MAG: PorT family protein [Bacteroidales bacterium]|nr:PorT family protein [Bacteroidales bacterium]